MISLPQTIEAQMRPYRAGFTALPESFNDFHADLAACDLEHRPWHLLESFGRQSDGWMDRAEFITVVVAVRQGLGEWSVKTLRWHESGAWFERSPAGGWIRFAEALDTTRSVAAEWIAPEDM